MARGRGKQALTWKQTRKEVSDKLQFMLLLMGAARRVVKNRDKLNLLIFARLSAILQLQPISTPTETHILSYSRMEVKRTSPACKTAGKCDDYLYTTRDGRRCDDGKKLQVVWPSTKPKIDDDDRLILRNQQQSITTSLLTTSYYNNYIKEYACPFKSFLCFSSCKQSKSRLQNLTAVQVLKTGCG